MSARHSQAISSGLAAWELGGQRVGPEGGAWSGEGPWHLGPGAASEGGKI